MLLRAVLDTNVVVSAHLSLRGFPKLVWDLALARKYQLYLSPGILAEYQEVLTRPELDLTPALIQASLREARSVAKLVRPKRKITLCSDPDDNLFLKCAAAGRCGTLVTGNKRHFPRTFSKTQIVSPREFVTLMTPLLSE